MILKLAKARKPRELLQCKRFPLGNIYFGGGEDCYISGDQIAISVTISSCPEKVLQLTLLSIAHPCTFLSVTKEHCW